MAITRYFIWKDCHVLDFIYIFKIVEMEKNKLVSIFLCFFMLILNKSFSQNENETYFIKFEVGELKYESKIPRFSSMGSILNYKGPLVNGVAMLVNSSISRVKVLGNIPLKLIYFRGEFTINDVIDTKSLILKTLQYKYKFKIFDIEDTTEVWVLKQLDNTKLQVHSMERDGPGGSGGLGDPWAATDRPVSEICKIVESVSKIITIDETNDDKHYNIPIILKSLMAKERFEELNEFLKANHGLIFLKERRLVKLKLIKFEE